MNREREQQTETEEQESQDNGWAVWWVLVMFYWDYQNDHTKKNYKAVVDK